MIYFTTKMLSPLKVKQGFVQACLGVLMIGSTLAQPSLDLHACVDYTLTHHESNRVYQNQAAISQQQAKEALAGYLPQINGVAALDDNLKRQTTIIPAGVFGSEDIRVQFGNQYSTTATVQLDQTIYDQSLIYGLRANVPNMEIARLKKEKNDEELIIQTAKAFYQVLATRQKLALLAENEQKFQEQLEVVKLQYEKGVAKKIDYDRMRVSLNNVRSQKQVLQTNEELALNRLRLAMGLPQEAELNLAEISLLDMDIEVPVSGEFDPQHNIDLQLQSQSIALQEIDLKRKSASRLPTVSAYGRYGAQALGNELGASYNNWFDFSSIGLKVNVPIFGGLRRYSQITQSSLNLENAKINYKLAAENLDMQLQNVSTILNSARINVANNRENLALAKDVFDNSTLQYEKGVAPFSDFVNADFAYKEAQNNYINSVLDYLTARLDYERASGSLSEYIQQL